MRVGFTGTRAGLSPLQASQLQYMLAVLRQADQAVGRQSEFRHGAASGADTQAALVAEQQLFDTVRPHPADGDPLARNRRIVALCDVLVAAPLTDKEVLRSGTWATVRYARAAGKPVIMLSRGV